MSTIIANYGELVSLQMVRGDTFDIVIEFERDSITLTSAYLTVKRVASSTTTIVQKTLPNGISKTGDAEYTAVLQPADTATLAPGTYDFDFQASADGEVLTPVLGKLNIIQDVTFGG